jgi:hypothetical protein
MSKINPLETSNKGSSMPGMTPALEDVGFDPSQFVYRVGHFTIGGEDDDTIPLETLLTRSLSGDVVVLERKDSISGTTGVYTCVVIYMEKRLHA